MYMVLILKHEIKADIILKQIIIVKIFLSNLNILGL